MMLTWLYLRRSTSIERRWLSVFYGNKIAEEIFRKYHYYRNIVIKQRFDRDRIAGICETVKGLEMNARKEMSKLRTENQDIFARYAFPLESLIALIWPAGLLDEQFVQD
jgi:hypothetical protein